MKNRYIGYYYTDEIIQSIWQDCIFFLDTNILLNTYRFPKDYTDTLFSILEKGAERFQITEHVAKEYHKNFNSTPATLMKSYDKIREEILNQKHYDRLRSDYQNRHPTIDINAYLAEIHGFLNSVVAKIDVDRQKHPDIPNLQKKIGDFFTDKIFHPTTAMNMDMAYKEAEQRYAQKIPPGYKDAVDKQAPDKYGDFVIWKEIIAFSIQNKKDIIFITDDTKEDWFSKSDEGKTLGPRPELLTEFHALTSQKCYIYQANRFFEFANNHFALSIAPQTIIDIKSFNPLPTEIESNWRFRNETKWLKSRFAKQMEKMKEWFYSRYGDPADLCPHDSSDGGYLYLNGGPFEAYEELAANFPYSDKLLEETAKEIEFESQILEWEKIPA